MRPGGNVGAEEAFPSRGQACLRPLLMLALIAFQLPLYSLDRIPLEEYRARRLELQKRLDGVLVLFGRPEREIADDRDGSFQEPNFLYLTGWNQPDAVLAISKSEEILFLPPHNEHTERYTGRKTGPDDSNARAITGFAKVMPRYRLESELLRLASESPNLYTLPLDDQAEKLKQLAPFHEYLSAAPLVGRLRMKKSANEISLIERAADISIAAHRAAWKRMTPGLYEYQIAATLMNVYREAGCERNAYPPIIGSGPNSVILHYSENRRRIDAGEVVVMDAAAECSAYAADITRTVPASGQFTPRQREIYQVVLGAQKAAIAAVKPGIAIGGKTNSLQQIAMDYINSHGKDLHGQPLGKYFLHGLGHHVGLEVHDPGDPLTPLEPGMVITIEPGIYIAEENIGVRIEDMVLVTADGGKVITAALPRELSEVEAAIGK